MYLTISKIGWRGQINLKPISNYETPSQLETFPDKVTNDRWQIS